MNLLRTAVVVAFLALPLAAQEAGDREQLTAGVARIGPPPGALPGEVIAFGERAFTVASVAAGGARLGVVGATRHGKGRVLAFGHNSFLGRWFEEPEAGRLLANGLGWLAARRPNAARNRTLLRRKDVLVLGGGEPLATWVEAFGADVSRSESLPSSLDDLELVLWVSGDLAPAALERLEAFVEDGGGLATGVCPWGRQQLWNKSGRSIRTDLPHNQLLGRMGLVFGPATAGGQPYALDEPSNASLHAGRAVAAVLELFATDAELAPGSADAGELARQVAALLRALPADDERFLPAIRAALADVDLAERVPAHGRRTRRSDAVAHLGMLLSTMAWQTAAPDEIGPAPGADFFPGAVPTAAERLTRTVRFDADAVERGGWLSTGLYAAPGEAVTVSLAESTATSGARGAAKASRWKLRIGAHKDLLWHKDRWSRWPEVTLERPLEHGSLTAASPFGGLVYLVPDGRTRGRADFVVEGAVEAPWFELGDPASLADWPRRREAPAPWGELACDGLVLTLPAGALRDLEDPVALMSYWQEAMACYPELRGEPQPARPERLVEDIQISAGWMHSGYPVMTHGADDREASNAVDLATLRTAGNWGYFHEFGHNAQKSDWTFAGTGEVTCNLFSLYLGERMAGIEPWNNAWLEGQKAKPAAHFASGADFAAWKSQPGLALMMYAEVQREFGWAPIQAALASYLDADAGPRPKSDGEKRDQWMLRLSRALERDLGPYFELWGVPVSESARAEIAALEDWLPSSYD